MHNQKNNLNQQEDTKRIEENSYIRKNSGVTLEEKNRYIQEQVTLIALELEDGKAEEMRISFFFTQASFKFYVVYFCIDDWLRGPDLNRRPSGYEPDELPGCSTPRHG
jgi:hypothetical protein